MILLIYSAYMSTSPIRYQIDITPRSFLIVGAGVATLIALWMIRDFVLLVVLAVIIASFVNAGVRVLKKVHIPRVLAVTTMYLFFIGIFIIFTLLFLPLFFRELVSLYELFPQNTGLFPSVSDFPQLVSNDGLQGHTLKELVVNTDTIQGLQNFWRTYFTDSVVNSVGNIISGFGKVFLVFIISFFLSIQEGGLNGFLRAITPIKYENYVIDLWGRTEQKIGYWFGGQLIIAIISAFIAFIGLSLFDVPYALLLSILILILEFVPFGMTIGTLFITPIAFLSGGVGLGVPVLLFMLVLNFIEAYVAQPLVVNKTVGIPMLLVVISVIAWVELIGWTGAIIAIPFSVLALELIYDREKIYLEKQREGEKDYENS